VIDDEQEFVECPIHINDTSEITTVDGAQRHQFVFLILLVTHRSSVSLVSLVLQLAERHLLQKTNNSSVACILRFYQTS
jgi:hypothetical protein